MTRLATPRALPPVKLPANAPFNPGNRLAPGTWALRLVPAIVLSVLCLALLGCKNSDSEPKPAARSFTPPPEPSVLPELGDIGQFELKDQGNRAVSRKSLEGKVWVASFFFTRCPVVCPRLTRKMREIQVQGKAQGLNFELVSFSVDPDNDTPEQLTTYAQKYQVDLTNWRLLTGDYEVVKQTSVKGFKLALEGKADPNADHFGILHGSHLVLVDSKAQIRGFYRPEDADSATKLLADIKRLTQ